MTRLSLGPVGLVALLAAASLPVTTALDPDYCADANVASMSAYYDDLQTNGLCHDHCFDDYAFAITQGNNCWCSNYGPADSIQISMSRCNQPCPAYPPESCGGKGAYSYLKLNNNIKASGSKGSGDDGKPTSTDEPTSTEDTSTSEPAPETTSSSSSKKSSSSASSSETETEETSTSSTSAKPTSSKVQTVTKDGIVTTVFIAPTNTAGDAEGANGRDGETKDANDGNDGGLSKGALAGIIVGVVAGVGAIAGALIWFFLRRRKTQQEQGDYQEDPSIRGSSSGMMGVGTRTEMSQSGGSPGSPNTNSNRNSALLIDPRMDPFKQGLYMRSNSHESINTLRDDHDYSRRIQHPRTLRATNPDPETQD